MSKAKTAGVGRKVETQCRQVLDFIESTADRILYQHWVPVPKRHIDAYAKATGKTFPPDLRHWLTTVGSGVVDYPDGCVEVPSLEDLVEAEEDGRAFGVQPRAAWDRIFLGYAGAPSARVIDGKLADRYGCCPVFVTQAYADVAEEVYASSWPMYLLGAVRWLAAGQGNMDGLKKWAAAQTLIDRDLPRAEKRTFAFNKTQSPSVEVAATVAAKAAGPLWKLMQVAWGKPRRQKGGKISSVRGAVRVLEARAASGSRAWGDFEATDRLEDRSARKDLPVLYRAAESHVRRVRKSAFVAIRRIVGPGAVPAQMLEILERTHDRELAGRIKDWVAERKKAARKRRSAS